MKLIKNSGNDRVLDELRRCLVANSKLDLASPAFSLFAFAELRDALDALASTRLLLPVTDLSLEGSPSDCAFRNRLQLHWIARACSRWIEKKVEVRSATSLIPQSIVVASAPDGQPQRVLLGSCAFTTEGLGITPGNQLSLVQASEGSDECAPLGAWFSMLWNNLPGTPEAKNALLARLSEFSAAKEPSLIYHLILHQLFKDRGEELDEERVVKSATGIKDTVVWKKLFRFQRDGVVGALDKLERLGGCIIADSVGLGKTFEALAIIKYYELRNDRVLVLCPKRLRDNWTLYKSNDKRNILSSDRFNYDVLNHTDLSRDDGLSGDIDLANVNWGNYDLVVIDESHNFRNKSPHKGRETRYDRLMRLVIQEGVKTRVLMLSATPVNNRLADLKNQIAFVTEGSDTALKEHGIQSIEATVRKAQQQFNRWLAMPIDDRSPAKLMDMLGFDYFKLLDLLTIARSRKHIEKYYGTTETGRFPERLKPINFKPDVDRAGKFRSIREINSEIRRLTLGAYAPMRYVLPSKREAYDAKYSTQVREGKSFFRQVDREESLVHLLRVNLLKRMESAVPSFTLTLQRQLKDVKATLAKIEAHPEEFEELDIAGIDIDDPRFETLLIGRSVRVLLQDMDIIRWKQDLVEDRDRLEALYTAALEVNAARDAKLDNLRQVIEDKIRYPINPGNKKIIVFTAFADTAHYLYENLSSWALQTLGVHSAIVVGSGSNKTTLPNARKDLATLLTAFSPRSKERPADMADEGEIDLLIATDCISEGQNLQDCDYLVNYDIHWNPVRIIQRFGRIDRIGSRNTSIQLVNFWPNIELEEYINLEQRVSGRMVLLDISATGEENLIDEQQSSGRMNDLEYRREQLLKLQDAVIDLEDLSSGVSIADLTLTDFRIDLARYLKENKDRVESMPLGAFSAAVGAGGDASIPPGVVFCLKAVGEAAVKAIDPEYPLAPYYLVHVGDNGEVLLPFTQAKQVLDRVKRLCYERNEPDSNAAVRFDRATRGGENMTAVQKLLSAAVSSVVGKKEERAVASLFTPGGTHALKGEFAGINDFEVVAFLAILPTVTQTTPSIELAIVTLKFEKPNDASFSPDEKQLCIKDSQSSLEQSLSTLPAALLQQSGTTSQDDIKLEVKFIGDGDGSYEVEFIVWATVGFIGLCGGAANAVHIVGQSFQFIGTNLTSVGQLLQSVAWCFTPQPGLTVPRPQCFGFKEMLDRRKKRCKACSFQTECVEKVSQLK